jgi:hypothetical protein
MGNRALVVFEDGGKEFSPVVYLHWHGDRAIEWLEILAGLMDTRRGDVAYSAARFVGIAHERVPGNLSLGIWNAPTDCASWGAAEWGDYSHGDEGLFLVDVRDWTVRRTNLTRSEWESIPLAISGAVAA